MTQSTQPYHPRLWPAVLIVAIQYFGRFILPMFSPEFVENGILIGLLGTPALILWWLFASRVPWLDRILAFVLIGLTTVAFKFLLHPSLVTGMEGGMYFIYMFPTLSLGFLIWALASKKLAEITRRITMIATIILCTGFWTLLQTFGFTSDINHEFAWRWTQSPEEQFLEKMSSASVSQTDIHTLGTISWSGFRGNQRDSVISNLSIETDWTNNAPKELWRKPVGPGWSSFAVAGQYFYTQEQYGEQEAVLCYELETGEIKWLHLYDARFWESNGGAGPRGTPVLHDGRVYCLGGTGVVTVLNASNGEVIWKRNAVEDTGAEIPKWGFASSPLIHEDKVIIAASGTLIAYDLINGEPQWTGPKGKTSYSSPQRFNVMGEQHILHINGDGLVALSPSDGELLWQHPWVGYPIVQPSMMDNGQILLSVESSSGIRKLEIQKADQWEVKETWTTNGLKPYSSDFVVHKGHAYGFDGKILSCISLENGERQWKGGRFGLGQMLLLAEQDLLLVLTEKGAITLVKATPEAFSQITEIQAIKGKTWNHPVIVGDTLLVRNGEEMVAFQLARQ